MFWDDDVQGAADRFLRQITKEFGAALFQI
jgi:hypothetical protein